MAKGAAKSRTTRHGLAPVSPINFRMPRALRTRLRRFADERHLSEAEALRTVVSEHLSEIENERELAAAERWQFAEAYATWDRFRRGEGRTVSRADIAKVFRDALAERDATHRA